MIFVISEALVKLELNCDFYLAVDGNHYQFSKSLYENSIYGLVANHAHVCCGVNSIFLLTCVLNTVNLNL